MHMKVTASVMTVTGNPTLAISKVVKPEGPNAIALGAVETGSMNAKEQTRVGGRAR